MREELVKCQEAEGVNALYACQHLAQKYVDMMKGTEHKVRAATCLPACC